MATASPLLETLFSLLLAYFFSWLTMTDPNATFSERPSLITLCNLILPCYSLFLYTLFHFTFSAHHNIKSYIAKSYPKKRRKWRRNREDLATQRKRIQLQHLQSHLYAEISNNIQVRGRELIKGKWICKAFTKKSSHFLYTVARFDWLVKWTINKHEIILFLSILRPNLLCVSSSLSMQVKKINISGVFCSQLTHIINGIFVFY